MKPIHQHKTLLLQALPKKRKTIEKPSAIRKIQRLIADTMKFIGNKLGVYIDLLQLYTPLGRLTDMIRAPKSLSKWNPFQHISPGFLSGTLRLPPPGELSKKPIDTSRIKTWATKSILQAGKLAQTKKNKPLADQIARLERAIKDKDEENILPHAVNLADMLIDIMGTKDGSDSNMAATYMQHIRDITKYVSQINQFDRSIQALTEPIPKVTITRIPTNKQELLAIALDQCEPLTRISVLKHLSEQDIHDMERAWLVNRIKLEYMLFRMCYRLEYPVTGDTWEKHKSIDDEIEQIHESLPQLLPASPIGTKEQLSLLVLDDIINNRKRVDIDSPTIALISESCKYLNSTQQDLVGYTLDDLDELSAALPTWLTDASFMHKAAQWCEDTMKRTIGLFGNAILDSLSQQDPSMDTEHIRSMMSDLVINSKIDLNAIATQGPLSPNALLKPIVSTNT